MDYMRLLARYVSLCLLLVTGVAPVTASTEGAPVVNVTPKTSRLNENGTTSVNCNAVGQSNLTVTIVWKRQGRVINSREVGSGVGVKNPSGYNVTGLSENGRAESTLKLSNGQRAMAGEYSCEASNSIDTTVETFSIQAAPVVVPDFYEKKSETFKEGSFFDLLCSVQGYPEPKVEWTIGGRVIVSSNDSTCVQHFSQGQCDGTTSRVTLENVVCNANCSAAGCSIYAVQQRIICSNVTPLVVVKSRLVVREVATSDSGVYKCLGRVGNMTDSNSTLIRIHSKLRPLWPSLGIIIEVIILAIIIFITEKYGKVKKRRKSKARNEEESSADKRDGNSPLSGLNSSSQAKPRKDCLTDDAKSGTTDSCRGLVTT
ncbi:uncharacterized protein LOC134191892 [Corticium candelabrum]|uniref:uncharacterized protein LOC134191892 n=1 Tax=Corticium candelabrum TaxID=121492 RepID=UPI002E2736E0|nr:uncharacterized protein LOC134191892 [Corticium candelabrum]